MVATNKTLRTGHIFSLAPMNNSHYNFSVFNSMKNISIDVPFGLSFTLRTGVPGVLSVEYHTSDTRATTQSEAHLQVPAVEPLTELNLNLPEDLGLDVPSSPSIATTDIIDVYEPVEQSKCTQDLKNRGIPARDFAFEHFPAAIKAREIFDPNIALYNYLNNSTLRVREVRQLWNVGWLTDGEARGAVPREQRAGIKRDFSLSENPWVHVIAEEPLGTRREQRDILRKRLRERYRDPITNPPPPPPRQRRKSTDCDVREMQVWRPTKRRRLAPESDGGNHPAHTYLSRRSVVVVRTTHSNLPAPDSNTNTPPTPPNLVVALPPISSSAPRAPPLKRTETFMRM